MNKSNEYEYLLRDAFGLALNEGEPIGRYGDPAKLADSDQYNQKGLDRAKVGVAYAIETILAVYDKFVSEDESYLSQLKERLFAVKMIEELDSIIEEVKVNVLEKYFKIENGKWLNQ